jgi:PrtD family type I secretion system ABC transporter
VNALFGPDERRLWLAAAAFSLAINVALLAPSLYMLEVFDRVLATRSVETLALLSLMAALALALMLSLDAARGRLLALAGALFEDRVGPAVLARLLDGVADGPERAFALRDVGSVRAFVSGPGIVALFDAPWLAVYVGVIFAFDARLGALALASALTLAALAAVNEWATRRGVERAQTLARDTSRFADAALRRADVVRALGMAPAIGARWLTRARTLHAQQLDTQRAGGRVGAATRGFRQAVQVAMMGCAAWLVIEQKATPGVMIAATIILGRALAPVEALIAHAKPLVEARGALSRLAALLGPDPRPAFDALPEPSGALAFEDVSLAIDGRPVVRGIRFDVAAGEVLGIVGPSGSGKSTLARLACGIVRPSAGSVRLDGADLAQWDPARLGARVGYLPQDVALLAGTVAENIARFGDACGDAVVDAARRAHAHEMIVRLADGYSTDTGDDGRRLSGGQRQQVALARALYGGPRLVVLDEPNASLDAAGEQALARAIAGLRAAKATVLLITQRTQALAMVDRIVVLDAGAIARIGVRSDAPALQPAREAA